MYLPTSAGILAIPPDDPVTPGVAESHASHAWAKTRGEYLLLVGNFHRTEPAVQLVFDYLGDRRKREEICKSAYSVKKKHSYYMEGYSDDVETI